VRRSRVETAETRQLILDTASREFRRNGIAETGLSDIMNSAGLTHGGFYRHFESKDTLVCEALKEAFDQLFEGLNTRIEASARNAALEALVDYYLTPDRRDDCELACPLTTLAPELCRANRSARLVASAGVDRFISTIQMLIADLPSAEIQARAVGVLSTLVGGMVLARLVEARSMSDRILRDAREFALQI
jgi:TetR/AcrR family transcriptional repressor of nem operon